MSWLEIKYRFRGPSESCVQLLTPAGKQEQQRTLSMSIFEAVVPPLTSLPLDTLLDTSLCTKWHLLMATVITWSINLSQVLVTPLFFHWSSLFGGLLFWYLSSICFRKRLAVNQEGRRQHERQHQHIDPTRRQTGLFGPLLEARIALSQRSLCSEAACRGAGGSEAALGG